MGIEIASAPLAYVVLLLTIAVSLYGLFMDPDFQDSNLFDMRAVIKGRQYHRLITSAFLHGDPGHLLVNMITLFFFGPIVEYAYGTFGFFLIYLGSQAGAEALTLWRKNKDLSYRALGASGAISGIVMAFCVYDPMATIYAFMAIPLPAFVFAGLYLAYTSFAMGGPGRIAHEAHLGGAIAGAIIAFIL